MTRFGHAMEKIDERIPGIDLPLMSVSQTRGVIRRSELTDALQRAESLDNYKVCRANDIVFNKMSIRSGAMGVAAEDGLVTYHYEVMRPRVGANPHFVAYLMKSSWFTEELIKRERGIGAGDQANVRTTEVPFSVLKTIDAYIPDYDEQCIIADYLDRETARIDTLIEEQQRLLVLLQERREAEVDSLLGSPSQARRTTVKRVLRPLSRPAVSGLGVVTAFRDGVVTLRSNRREDGYTFSTTENGYQEIRPGDLVFHALDGFAGAVGVSDSHGNATPVYHVCAAIAGDHLPYVARLLRYLGRSGFLATQAPNVRERSVDFRNWSMFGRLPLALPPVVEQRRVASHLEEQAAKVDKLVAETKWLIELARERRAALITAAVTGRIDVREVT